MPIHTNACFRQKRLFNLITLSEGIVEELETEKRGKYWFKHRAPSKPLDLQSSLRKTQVDYEV